MAPRKTPHIRISHSLRKTLKSVNLTPRRKRRRNRHPPLRLVLSKQVLAPNRVHPLVETQPRVVNKQPQLVGITVLKIRKWLINPLQPGVNPQKQAADPHLIPQLQEEALLLKKPENELIITEHK